MVIMDALPLPAVGSDPDGLFTAFGEWAATGGTVLYPAQEEALIELVSGANDAALGADRTSFYTAPIKALVSEKFFALCEVFGAANVGMLTGDAAVNADAPIIACTAEVLANVVLRE